jgi:hypothetical protein
VFTETFPSYPIDREKDFTAALQIAFKIGKSKGWEKTDVLNKKKAETVKFWEQIVHEIATDKWYSTRSISDLNNEWQRLIMFVNGKAGQPAVKETTGVGSLINQARKKAS